MVLIKRKWNSCVYKNIWKENWVILQRTTATTTVFPHPKAYKNGKTSDRRLDVQSNYLRQTKPLGSNLLRTYSCLLPCKVLHRPCDCCKTRHTHSSFCHYFLHWTEIWWEKNNTVNKLVQAITWLVAIKRLLFISIFVFPNLLFQYIANTVHYSVGTFACFQTVQEIPWVIRQSKRVLNIS